MTALARGELQFLRILAMPNPRHEGSHTPTLGDIGAPSAGNAGFVVIQTHLSFGF
jgi:hypothetical protein